MTHINTYLTFNGNCREAMTFYKDCLGGELMFQTIGESPMAAQIPLQMQQSILHCTLSRGNLLLMASDMVGDDGLSRGNAVSMMLDCDSEQEVKECYEKLSAGGKAVHPLELTFWGATFGNLTDKFGNHWLLIYNNEQ
jgi:PhnB protein